MRHFLIFFSFIVLPTHMALASIDLAYLKAQVGLSMQTDGHIDNTEVDTDIDPPYPMNLGAGVYVTPLFSVALEINYESAKLTKIPSSVTDDDVKRFGSFLNLYFHFPNIVFIEPYLGGGAGYALVTIDDNNYKGDGFLWQLSGGVDINLNDFMALTAEARFLEPFEIDLENEAGNRVGDFDFSQSKLLVGLKIKI